MRFDVCVFIVSAALSFVFLSCTVLSLLVFKMALMFRKCLHGVAPAYLSDLCIPATAISGR